MKYVSKNDLTTREGWLNEAVILMTPWFKAQDKPLPEVAVSTGFGGPRHSGEKVLGVCWCPEASEDKKTRHILIAPSYNDPTRVLDVLLHELVHAALPFKVGHRKPFKDLATALGLTGKMTATVATPELKKRLQEEIVDKIGKYPHLKLSPTRGFKKQSTRLIKCECPSSGYVCRTTKKWLIAFGAPLSPATKKPMEFDEDEVSEE